MTDDKLTLSDRLWNKNVNPETYGSIEKYLDHILEQYKIYVEMADRISSRRNLTNTFFLTLHSLIFAAIGFLCEKVSSISFNYLLIFSLVVVLILCYTWWRLVKSYRQLNTAKYLVIGEMEKKLPSSPLYLAEWKALGEGKNRKLYVPLTHIENWIPIVFGLMYILGFLLILVNQLISHQI